MTPAELRTLYNRACHGEGAAPRWAARDAIEDEADRLGVTEGDLLREHDLCLAAYYATMPISREGRQP